MTAVLVAGRFFEPAYIKIRAPKPGRAVLGCRCGAAVDSADMRRMPMNTGNRGWIAPIVCPDCALNRSW